MSLVRSVPVLTLAALGTLACADGGDPNDSGAHGLTVAASITQVSDGVSAGAGETGPPPEDGDSSGAHDVGGVLSVDTGADTGDDPAEACVELAEVAMKQQPADIVFVIDNSGSMQVEAASVKDNMNDFSSAIIDSGVDVHVVLISATSGANGMCIDPPLGSGGCPVADSKPPTFLHIDHKVGSTNALQKLLDYHDEWRGQMRPDARKHLVVVSDDDSELDAAAFDAAFKALDPTYEDYRFHAIVGENDASDAKWCASEPVCCDLTAAAGTVYLELIEETDGVHGDLCKQDFAPVFDTLSAAVIQNSGLACEWAIPTPMGDVVIDLDAVDVEFDDGMGVVLAIGEVTTMAACAEASDGWYYDAPDQPGKLLLCPQTCAKIQLAPKGSTRVSFGCKPLIPQ